MSFRPREVCRDTDRNRRMWVALKARDREGRCGCSSTANRDSQRRLGESAAAPDGKPSHRTGSRPVSACRAPSRTRFYRAYQPVIQNFIKLLLNFTSAFCYLFVLYSNGSRTKSLEDKSHRDKIHRDKIPEFGQTSIINIYNIIKYNTWIIKYNIILV